MLIEKSMPATPHLTFLTPAPHSGVWFFRPYMQLGGAAARNVNCGRKPYSA